MPTRRDGQYRLSGLRARTDYAFRPAGSGWDFRDVPVRRTLSRGDNRLDFVATPMADVPARPSAPARLPGPGPRDPLAGVSAGLPQGSLSIEQRMDAEARRQLTGLALNVAAPNALGVLDNGFGMRDRDEIIVHLSSLVTSAGTPARSLRDAYAELVPQLRDSGSRLPMFRGIDGAFTPPIRLLASSGPPVQGAEVRATLWLGNELSGERQVSTIAGQTNADGVVGFRFEAGRHSEDMRIVVEVRTNPANPWLTPTTVAFQQFFAPSRTRDDSVAPVQYRFAGTGPVDDIHIGVRLPVDLKRLPPVAAPKGALKGGEGVQPMQARLTPAEDSTSARGKVKELGEVLEERGRQFVSVLRWQNAGSPVLDAHDVAVMPPRSAQAAAGAPGQRSPATPGQRPPVSAPRPAVPAPVRGGAAPRVKIDRLPATVSPAELARGHEGSSGAVMRRMGEGPRAADYLEWTPSGAGDRVQLIVDASQDMELDLFVSLLRSPETGGVRVSVAGRSAGEIVDGTAVRQTISKLLVGTVRLRKGDNEFQLQPLGAGRSPIRLLGLSFEKH